MAPAPSGCRLCAQVFTILAPTFGLNLRDLAESAANLRISCLFPLRAIWPANCTYYQDVLVPCGGSMRPYLVLSVLVLLSVAVFGQSPLPYSGVCYYGCGPFVPRLTTPEISLQTFSPNPVGASNATTGLIAGATNSTLSQVQGSTSSVYTVAVWLQGGDSPLMTRNINLSPERINREGHAVRESMREPRPLGPPPLEERSRQFRAREERHEE